VEQDRAPALQPDHANWRGKPLSTLEVVVGLIANTSTQTGLKVRAATDQKPYRTGIKVSDAEMKQLSLVRDDFHGDWNYSTGSSSPSASARSRATSPRCARRPVASATRAAATATPATRGR
jgi:hypothetical protein